jgi:uncharacterized protein YbjT (DUF2867 family)
MTRPEAALGVVMTASRGETIVVAGATGRQGGAVTRHLLRDGWRVRALTRRPDGAKAQALAALGAEVVRADMGDRASLLAALRGARGVYSVQNPMTSGPAAEVRQGQLVAEVAKEVGVGHVVYASAGTGQAGTGIGSWESKLAVERHLRELGVPATVLRPTAFMELMTDKGYFPAASTWHVMPGLMGEDRPVGWLSVDDLGAIAAAVFAAPDRFVGADLKLASDVQPIGACRALYREVVGKAPPRFPMPVWLFERIVGPDLTTMWRWLRTAEIDLGTATARAIHPGALTVRAWLDRQTLAGRG